MRESINKLAIGIKRDSARRTFRFFASMRELRPYPLGLALGFLSLFLYPSSVVLLVL